MNELIKAILGIPHPDGRQRTIRKALSALVSPAKN